MPTALFNALGQQPKAWDINPTFSESSLYFWHQITHFTCLPVCTSNYLWLFILVFYLFNHFSGRTLMWLKLFIFILPLDNKIIPWEINKGLSYTSYALKLLKWDKDILVYICISLTGWDFYSTVPTESNQRSQTFKNRYAICEIFPNHYWIIMVSIFPDSFGYIVFVFIPLSNAEQLTGLN